MPNKQLEKEILAIKKSTEKMTEQEILKLAKDYKKSLAEIRAIALTIYTKYSIDDELEMTNVQITNELNRIDKVLQKEARRIGLLEIGLTTALLSNVFEESYYKTAYTLDKGIDIGINFNLLRKEFVEAAINVPIEGIMYSDRVWNNKAKMMQRLRSSLKEAMEKGTSIEKLSRKMSKDLGSDYYNSYRLLRTESAKVQTLGQQEIYNSSGVGRIMWSATLDEATNPEDAELDGQMWNIDENHPTPPLHPNCRCVLIPVVDGWSPTKRRDNETGDVINYSNFNDWKKTKGIN